MSNLGRMKKKLFLSLIMILAFAYNIAYAASCSSCGRSLSQSGSVASVSDTQHRIAYRCTNISCPRYGSILNIIESHIISATTVAPTCTSSGHTTKRCARCNYSKTEYTNPLGHSFGSYTSVNSSYHTRTCNRCGQSKTESHIFDNSTGQCTICYYKNYVVKLPTTKTFQYNGYSRTVMTVNYGYTYTGIKSATNSGNYSLTMTLKSGYRWSDGSYSKKTINWSITPLNITIKAKPRIVELGSEPNWGIDNVYAEGLVGTDELADITIIPSISTSSVGTGVITPSNGLITRNGTNITSNYAITYEEAVYMVHNTEISNLELNVVPKMTIDITNAETQITIQPHDCNNYSYDIFDSSFHYKVCKLCHDAFEKYKEAEFVSDDYIWPIEGSEIVNDLGGYGGKIIVLKNSYVAHALPTSSSDSNHWKWSGGGKKDCATSNHLYKFCTYDCGYSYLVPDSESGKSAHTATIYSDDRTVTHGAAHLYWHRNCCSKCGKRNFTSEDTSCYKSKTDKKNKVRIKCNNLGKCYLCGYEYTVKYHYVPMNKSNNTGRCKYCNTLYVFLDENGNPNDTLSVSKTSDTKRKITFNTTLRYAPIESEGRSLTSCSIHSTARKYALNNVEDFAMTPTINNKKVKLVGTYEYSDYHVEVKNGVSVRFHEVLSNGQKICFNYETSKYGKQLQREYTAPVFNRVSGDSILNYEGWSTKKEFTIEGTENYCSKITLSMEDLSATEDNKYILDSIKRPVNSKKWTYVFSPNIAAGVEGKHFVLSVADTLSNTKTYDLFVNKIDSVAPKIKTDSTSIEPVDPVIGLSGDLSGDSSGDYDPSEDDGEYYEEENSGDINGTPLDDTVETGYIRTAKEWSHSKHIQIAATDEGIRVAEIKLQDVGGIQDDYGVTSLSLDDSNEIQYIRDYEFVGDVKGYKLLSVGSKDPLGNSTSSYIKIFNIDNTSPVISDVAFDIQTNKLTANIMDGGSGVKSIGLVTGDRDFDYPNRYINAVNNEVSSTNLWYKLQSLYQNDYGEIVDPATYSGDVIECGIQSDSYEFNITSNGTYYIVTEDYAGNRAYEMIDVTEIDDIPPTGDLIIPNTRGNIMTGKEYINKLDVTLRITAEDDNSGVDKIALVNENEIPDSLDDIEWIDWENNPSVFTNFSGDSVKERAWRLSGGEGVKVIYMMIKDKAGNTTVSFVQ